MNFRNYLPIYLIVGTRELSADVEWILVALLFVLPVIGSICQSQSNIVFNHIGKIIIDILNKLT